MKTLNTLAKKTRIEEPSTAEVTKNFYDLGLIRKMIVQKYGVL